MIESEIKPKGQRGGARPGAGRKPVKNGLKKIIVLTPDLWEHAQKIGGGNASKGVRLALEHFNKAKTGEDHEKVI